MNKVKYYLASDTRSCLSIALYFVLRYKGLELNLANLKFQHQSTTSVSLPYVKISDHIIDDFYIIIRYINSCLLHHNLFPNDSNMIWQEKAQLYHYLQDLQHGRKIERKPKPELYINDIIFYAYCYAHKEHIDVPSSMEVFWHDFLNEVSNR